MCKKRSNKFRNPVVHYFQLKLLRNETSGTNEDRKRYEEKLVKAQSLVKKKSTNSGGHSLWLEKLSERQDEPLRVRNEQSVKVLDNIELAGWVHEMLSVDPKHPIRDKVNETHIWANIDIFLAQLKNQKTPGEILCEIKTAAKTYAKKVGKLQETKPLKKRGNGSKIMGCWLCLLTRGWFLHNEETNVWIKAGIIVAIC